MVNFVNFALFFIVMINIYKIGGNVINNPDGLKSFLRDFSDIQGSKILVHGGGKEATDFAKKMGHEAVMIQGRRVTDRATLDMVTMVYAGLINKRIVSILQDFSCDAVGLTGADGNVIPASKRSPVPIDYGFVGDIDPEKINVEFLKLLLHNGFTPVFCAICRDQEGGLLNCNADSIAAALAIACSSFDTTNLYYCFEKPGVLEDIDNPASVIPFISQDTFHNMVESGKISDGMIPKVSNALKAIEQGVNSVVICDASSISTNTGTIIGKK